MIPHDLLLEVFWLVDDELQAIDPGRLRHRGPLPTLADSEVITMELVGESWGGRRCTWPNYEPLNLHTTSVLSTPIHVPRNNDSQLP
jgi:hypothetical protein